MKQSRQEIVQLCGQLRIRNYKINNDGSVDVHDSVNLSGKGFTYIPIKFGTIKGSFSCYANELVSLQNCPHTVGGFVDIDDNQLTSLEHAPRSIGSYFTCVGNLFTNLDFFPDKIVGSIHLSGNPFEMSDEFFESIEHIIKRPEVYRYYQYPQSFLSDLEVEIKNRYESWAFVKQRLETINKIINH